MESDRHYVNASSSFTWVGVVPAAPGQAIPQGDRCLARDSHIVTCYLPGILMGHTPSATQARAITADPGPVLVLAGPGAGKTYCLIERVRFLLERGAVPERVCAVTFTNKAAEEIALRLRDVPKAHDVTRGTLHSLCLGFLRDYGDRLGLPRGFGVADELYQELVLRRLRIHPRRHKELLDAFGRRRLRHATLDADVEAVFERYREELNAKRMIDFDDIIAHTGQLFAHFPDVAQDLAARWDHLLVDEFQDLDRTQFEILAALAAGHRSLFAVGDDEQSIFAWRGADPEVLERFGKDFGIETPVVLEENHRCSVEIFDAARKLIGQNPSLFDKELVATRRSGVPVEVREFPDDDAEFAWLLEDIRRDQREHSGGWGERAVLYRSHDVGERLERWFLEAGIPCRLPRGRALQDDDVIAYVLASLRILARPDDPLMVEYFAERVLTPAMRQDIRARHQTEGEDFLSAIRAFAVGRPGADPEARMAWRFIYHVENLAALGERHDSMEQLLEELLVQRAGKYQNPLILREDALRDPADMPEAQGLARRLRTLADSGGRLWITRARGLEFALRRLAKSGGARCTIRYLTDPGAVGDEDWVLDANEPGVTRRLFKALQLLAGADAAEPVRRCVCFDLETTDKDAGTCDIVEIGAVRVVDGVVVDTFHRLVRPDVPIAAQASAVHGYTDADVADAPGFAEVWPAFKAFVGDDLLVAHNAWRFDLPVLERKVAEVGDAWTVRPYDTYPLAKSLFADSARLVDLANRFGVGVGRAHHALDDARTLAGVLQGLWGARAVRARRSALANVLDTVGLALALENDTHEGEDAVLFEAAHPATLGSYSDCLDRYAAERETVLGPDALPVEEVIDRLGGWKRMNAVRVRRPARERYPRAMARLLGLVALAEGETLAARIEHLLERVALSTSRDVLTDPNRVSLLTVHSTKGLEFSRVYVAGVEDYKFPGYWATERQDEREYQEARRLLYVAMTRARDRLVLTRAEVRQGRPTGGRQFLDEIGLPSVQARLVGASPSQ